MKFVLGRDRDGQLVAPERSLFRDHCSILGNPGTGKSQICLGVLKQAVLRPDPDVRLIAYLDRKGDPVPRNWLAEHTPAGWELSYFTTTEHEESCTYDPLAHVTARFKTATARNDAMCSRLGLTGASREPYFRHLNLRLGLEAWQKVERDGDELKGGLAQFYGILEALREKGREDFKHATDILNRVKALAACPRLTGRPGTKALVVPRLFERPTILCASLPVLEGTDTGEYVAKFLLGDLALSANGRRALVCCDEAHRLFNSRATLQVAEQCREFGIGLVLAAQSAEQYETEDGKPLGWLVDKLARVKLQFSPNTVDDLKKHMVLSDLKDVRRTSVTVSSRPGADGLTSAVSESVTTFEDKETRLGLNDVFGHARRPMSFVLQIDHDEQYGSPTLVSGAWPLTTAEYEALRAKPWPAPEVPEGAPPAPPPPAAPGPAGKRRGKSPALKACEDAAEPPPRRGGRRKKK